MITSVQLGTGETTIKQAGASDQVGVLSLMFCNTSASTRTITCYAYASGGSAGDGTTFIKELEIDSKDTFLWTSGEKFIIENSDTITGLADAASSVTVTVNSYTL
jgi:hypothetical protein